MADTTKHEHAGDGSGRTRVPLVADVPLRDPALDGFGFAVFANALALVVDHERTATPLTIAVSAPWGGGKSSVGAMTQTLLERRVQRRRGDEPRLVVWFNAWDHEDAAHLGAALAGAVAREASRHRSWWRRALFPLPRAMRDAGEGLRATLVLGALSLALAGLLMAFPPTRDLADGLLGEEALPGGAGTVGALFVAALVFQRVFASARSAAQFIDDPRSAAARGSMAEVKHQFGTLIRHATRDGRLVILVDDLDRCESARALEVCRVASQLLAHEGVVTILLADMTSISASAAIRFAADDGPESATEVEDDVGRRYLEKIVQIELALPPPDPIDMRAASSGYSDFLRASPASADADDPTSKQAGLTRLVRAAGALGRRGRVPWQAVIRWVDRAKWWPALVGISAAFALVAALSPAEGDGYAPDWSGNVLIVTTLVTVAIGVWSSALRRRHRRRRETYKRTIEELKDRAELSEQDIEAEILGSAQAVQPAAEHGLIGDLVSSSFLDSAEFRAVERFIADHPRRLPREGKRMFNLAQLLTEIARARQMFGGDPPLAPEHLAKWVVLRERWPAIGRAVLLSPELLRDLEDAAGADRVAAPLHALAVPPNDADELTALLMCEPKLGGLIERLIYFTPAARSGGPHDPSPERSAPSKRFTRRSAAGTELTDPRPSAT